METLEFLKKMMEDEMRISKEFSLGSNEEFIKELNEAIEELESLESKSCEGCKFGKFGVDSMGYEVECTKLWTCARGHKDKWKAKQ